MKILTPLLFPWLCAAAAVVPLPSRAELYDPSDEFTIIEDSKNTYSVTDDDGNVSTVHDPNGSTPPQPEADYYVNPQNTGSIYYRLLPGQHTAAL